MQKNLIKFKALNSKCFPAPKTYEGIFDFLPFLKSCGYFKLQAVKETLRSK